MLLEGEALVRQHRHALRQQDHVLHIAHLGPGRVQGFLRDHVQRLEHRLRLQRCRRHHTSFGLELGQPLGQQTGGHHVQGDLLLGKQGSEAVHQIAQLAHIARPGIGLKHRQEIGPETDGQAPGHGKAAREVQQQIGDVVAAFAQGRGVQGQHVQAVIEVFPETAGGNLGLQVAVGGGHRPHIHRHRTARTHGFDAALLQHAQQFDLHVQRHVADLVEEQGAAVGQLKAANAVGVRAGEGALAVTEQLAFEQFFGNGAAIDRHKMGRTTRRLVMQTTRHQLFAGPAFAGDQHRGGRGRHLGHHVTDGLGCRTVAEVGGRCRG